MGPSSVLTDPFLFSGVQKDITEDTGFVLFVFWEGGPQTKRHVQIIANSVLWSEGPLGKKDKS